MGTNETSETLTANTAAAGCEVRRIRAEALPKIKGGLRALYRTLELPGKNPLSIGEILNSRKELLAPGQRFSSTEPIAT